jgi:hypothetical protein
MFAAILRAAKASAMEYERWKEHHPEKLSRGTRL